MADQTVLSTLCSVCNSKQPKYRCPGCSTRTCSLPCYKRHQQRAQCSGKRDPTGFVKRSDLTTPAGIDHDYNFISGIERAVDRAEEDAEERGIAPYGGHDRHAEKAYLRRRIEEAGVIVRYAPKGMSRQKVNKTRMTKKKAKIDKPTHIIWTVEWKDGKGSSEITEVRENATLIEAYDEVQRRLFNMQKRKANGEVNENSSSQKRYRLSQEIVLPPSAEETVPLDKSRDGDIQTTSIAAETENVPHDRGGKHDQDVEPKHNALQQKHLRADDGTPSSYFYLLKPFTSSSKQVLIPIDQTHSVANVLEGQLVLEFPTIFVLSQSPSALPEAFQLEGDYMRQIQEDEKEVNEFLASVDQRAISFRGTGTGEVKENITEGRSSELDDKRLLEVLWKDIGA